jgi:hypothetical protein
MIWLNPTTKLAVSGEAHHKVPNEPTPHIQPIGASCPMPNSRDCGLNGRRVVGRTKNTERNACLNCAWRADRSMAGSARQIASPLAYRFLGRACFRFSLCPSAHICLANHHRLSLVESASQCRHSLHGVVAFAQPDASLLRICRWSIGRPATPPRLKPHVAERRLLVVGR